MATALSQKLAALTTAEFPLQYNQFAADVPELKKTPAGKRVVLRWARYAASGAELPGGKRTPYDCPAVFFLPLLQAELAADELRPLRQVKTELRKLGEVSRMLNNGSF